MNLNSSYLLINPNTYNKNIINDNYYYIISDDTNITRKKKVVTFNTNVSFKIIPNRDFLRYHNLIQELWWKNDDYNLFKSQSMIEIIKLSQIFPFVNKKQIARMLYQP